MRTNRVEHPRTHEGARAAVITPAQQLRRSVLACMLWEDEFYEDGVSIASRIGQEVKNVDPLAAFNIAVEARQKMKLRHAPLWIAVHMAALDGHKRLVGKLLPAIIQRPDEITEFLALYWKDCKRPLSKQIKVGIAKTFNKFDAYQFAKWDSKNSPIRIRDAMFLVHPKPENEGQAKLFEMIANDTLPAPDTWEVALSAGADKRETFERLLRERKLGALALLRNLRNMIQSRVPVELISSSLLEMKAEKVLPFRFVAAARHAPVYKSELEKAMFRCIANIPKMSGKTALLVDVSASMDFGISRKSDMDRMDAAIGLAILANEVFTDLDIYSFSEETVLIPKARGFALGSAIRNSQGHWGTRLGKAVSTVNSRGYDRIIVFTDEQSTDHVPHPKGKGYMINVASYRNGLGYGAWTHIDGFSEAVLDYIREYENQNN